MDRWIHLAEMVYTQHATLLILGILGCIFILMIINLIGVRRCRKQILRLTDKSRDVMKLALSQRVADSPRSRGEYRGKKDDSEQKKGHAVTKSEEELFGSVIQEMFP